MQKPQGYDNAQSKEYTGFNKPAPGAYVLGIVSAEATQSSKGDDMLVLSLDIAEGEFKGYFRKKSDQFEGDKLLKHRRLTSTEKSLPYFKGDIKAIEESNSGYKFNFDEKTLRGKFVGGMLGEKEFAGRDGQTATALEVSFICSVAKAKSGTLKIPAVKQERSRSGSDFDQSSSYTAPSQDDCQTDDLPF